MTNSGRACRHLYDVVCGATSTATASIVHTSAGPAILAIHHTTGTNTDHSAADMRAYYLDDVPGDQRLPHDSGRAVALETLAALGVLYWRIPTNSPEGWEKKINAIADERNYRSRDVVTASRESLGGEFDAKMAMFFKEWVVL